MPMSGDATFGEEVSARDLGGIGPLVGVHRDRYVGAVRFVGATLTGIVAGILLASSMQVGVGFALEGHNPPEWGVLMWGDHWVWRAVASGGATAAAAFLAGMVARRRGARVAVACTLPTAAYWAVMAWIGWTGHVPFSGSDAYIPLGYRIVATILCLVSLPLARAAGVEGAGFGRANAEHFDGRRATFLGVRWYHFLWLPILIHLMVITAAFGGVYGIQWFVVALRNGWSILVIIPSIFYLAMLMTLQLLGTGAFHTYEALAGFTDGAGKPVWRQVIKFGFGYTILTALAQAAVTLVHYGLYALGRRFLG